MPTARIAVIAAAIAVVLVVRRPDAQTAEPRVASDSGSAVDLAVAKPTIDSANVASVVVDATAQELPAIDAAVPVAAVSDAGVTSGIGSASNGPAGSGSATEVDVRRPTVTARGELRVFISPWAEVIVDGKNLGQTPVRTKLSVGRHRVQIKNATKQKTVTVNITANKPVTIEETW